jgi:poly(A) polymerase
LLYDHGLFQEMFPATAEELARDEDFRRFTRAALQNTDRRVRQGKSVTPMFLLGVFLWWPVKEVAAARRAEEKESESQSLAVAAYEIAGQQQQRIALPKRFTMPMREMLSLQPRFESRRGKRAMKLLNHRRFRAAYDFMMLLAEVGLVSTETADFWTRVQSESADERAQSFDVGQGKAGGGKRRPRRRRRRQPAREK